MLTISERIAVVLVATGPYEQFLRESLESLRHRLFIGHERRFFVLTDRTDSKLSDVSVFYIPHLSWPHNTLFRYHYMRHLCGAFTDVDVVAYIDVDMVAETHVPLSEVITPQTNYFGVQHPWHGPGQGTFEANPTSTAWIDRSMSDIATYWQACFWGGRVRNVVGMIELLAARVATDISNGVVADWHDESHLNRFFVENKSEVLTLDPGFAFPEGEDFDYVPRIRHVAKPFDQFPCLPGPPVELIRDPPVPRPLQ